MDIIKNFLNYNGSKDRILPLIKENLPKDCTTFIDLFGGSGVVSLNVDYDTIIYNEKNIYVYNLIRTIKECDLDFILNRIEFLIEQYGLSKNNKEGYLKMRNDFNDLHYKLLNDKNETCRHASNLALLTLIYHAFNYQIVFNKSSKFSVPSGVGRSWFNPTLKNKLINYKNRIDEIEDNLVLLKMDYKELYYEIMESKSLDKYIFFIDPPYFISDDVYSRTNSFKWTGKDEEDLYTICDEINRLGGKFCLTNLLQKGDIINDKLLEFSKKYNIINTHEDFYNSSYQRKNVKDVEILVKNY